MVQRTLQRLCAGRQVLQARLPDGVPAYALARRGAERLRGEYAAAYSGARSGADLLRNIVPGGEWRHRCLVKELVLWGIAQTAGSEYPVVWWTERDVLARRTPGSWGEGRLVGRRPDALALVAATELMWLEAERSNKCARSHRRLMEALRLTDDDLREDGAGERGLPAPRGPRPVHAVAGGRGAALGAHRVRHAADDQQGP